MADLSARQLKAANELMKHAGQVCRAKGKHHPDYTVFEDEHWVITMGMPPGADWIGLNVRYRGRNVLQVPTEGTTRQRGQVAIDKGKVWRAALLALPAYSA